MYTSRIRQRFTAVLGALIVLSLLAIPATATHSWGKYHWSRTTPGSLTLDVGDNTTNGWSTELAQAVADWNDPVGVTEAESNLYTASGGTMVLRDGAPHEPWGSTTPAPITLSTVQGTAGSNCSSTSEKIEVCNGTYGTNVGWLGVAQIWTKGAHITRATAKLNDSLFTIARYEGLFGKEQAAAALAADRQATMCQEMAHDFGLDHNDEIFGNPNTGTCMDYGNSPFYDEHPNYHDYEQLALIYSHADHTKTPGGKGNAIGNNPSEWGQVIARDSHGLPSHYQLNLGDDEVITTFVIWAHDAPPPSMGDGTSDPGTSDPGKKADGKQDGGGGKKEKKQQGHHHKHRR